MKLYILSGCVVGGGKTVEPKQIYDTKVDDPKDDKEAYTLISTGRAIDAESEEAQKLIEADEANATADDDSAKGKGKGKAKGE